MLILGDPTLISRAFSNLISNSLKYSKENSKVEVSIKETSINGVEYGVFTIKNTPKEEISEKEVKNFFKRLYKRDKGRSEDGSGLGLTIAKEIVKEHNGFLECKLKGKDLEFIIGIKILKYTWRIISGVTLCELGFAAPISSLVSIVICFLYFYWKNKMELNKI